MHRFSYSFSLSPAGGYTGEGTTGSMETGVRVETLVVSVKCSVRNIGRPTRRSPILHEALDNRKHDCCEEQRDELNPVSDVFAYY